MAKKNTSLWIEEGLKQRLKDRCKAKELSLEKYLVNMLEKTLPNESNINILLSVPRELLTDKTALKEYLQQRCNYLTETLK